MDSANPFEIIFILAILIAKHLNLFVIQSNFS